MLRELLSSALFYMDIVINYLRLAVSFLYGMLIFLFDKNGLHIITGYIVLLVIDVIVGTAKAGRLSKLKSRTYLYGIFMKFLGILTVIVANVLDDVTKNYMNMNFGADLSTLMACGLVGYEAISILENMTQAGIFTGKLQDTLIKIFGEDNK